MTFGREVGLGPGDIVLDGGSIPSPKKVGAQPPSPIFGHACLLWPNDRPPELLLQSTYFSMCQILYRQEICAQLSNRSRVAKTDSPIYYCFLLRSTKGKPRHCRATNTVVTASSEAFVENSSQRLPVCWLVWRLTVGLHAVLAAGKTSLWGHRSFRLSWWACAQITQVE